MKKILSTIMLSAALAAGATVPSRLVTTANGAVQLQVNGEPFIMLAGELHNSSNSTVEYMNSLWPSLKALNLNTVLASVAWEQLEPQEGKYDFTLVDNLIEGARQNDLKVVILWFGSWKNGESSYAPGWVKTDTKRFRRVLSADGKEIETLSPFCDATRDADARAYRAMVEHISKIDADHGTVIAIQPENEVGVFQDIDYSAACQKVYSSQVPSELVKYMKANKKTLRPELLEAWQSNGSREKGTWGELFGDNQWGKTFCMSWQYASYINEVAKQGKEVYPLPTFCNCWIVQNDQEKPGDYPNGGPVSRVFDVWKAAAPAIDVLCPDIYLSQFKEITADYRRHDNPLLIPESTMDPARAFWAFAEHDAICYSPFGIEDGVANHAFAQSYKVLGELMPLITAAHGTDNLAGVMRTEGEDYRDINMGDYNLHIQYDAPEAYGLVIQTSPGEFVVAGINFRVFFSSNRKNRIGYIRQVWEGGYNAAGEWVPTRLLNGDETYHNAVLIAKGRKHLTDELANNYAADHSDAIFVYSPESYKALWSPGIYHVSTYLR